MPASSPSVFISYSSRDKDAADSVRGALMANDIAPWMAPYSLNPGEDWSAGIIQGLAQCHAVVLVFSQNANDSVQVRREVERSFERGLPVIPLFIEDVVLHPSMEYYLSNVHWLVATGGLDDRHLTKLVQRIAALLNDKEISNPTIVAPSAPSPPPPTYPNNLPQSLSSFVGREKHRQALAQYLGQHRVVTLTAIGGSGKTRLALQVAQEILSRYPDGIWFVEFASLSDPGRVPQTVAAEMGVREQADSNITRTLTERLKDRHLLLVLDNAEHLLSACATLVVALLRSCPQIKVLITSREPLGISGEQIYRIPPLSLPTLDQVKTMTAASLAQFESAQLFAERACLVKPSFEITDTNASSLAQLCYHLDGIPLAIELAAARVRSLTVEQINDKLDNRFRLLTGGDRSALPRQQTLRALIDWSYDLLNETEKVLLARLSVFAGGWTLEAVETICTGGIVEYWEVLDLLTSLADKSLIIYEETPGEQAPRYRMLEMVREYAAECLSGSDEETIVRERHIDFFLALAEKARPKMGGPEESLWRTRLETEHDNLRAALNHCATEATSRAVLSELRLSGALWYFWNLHGYLSEGREYLTQALSRRQAMKMTDVTVKAAVANGLRGAGVLAYSQSDYSTAHSLLEESLALYYEIGNKQGIASTQGILGHAVSKQGDYSAARSLLENSLTLSREIGNRQGITGALMGLGRIAFYQGDYPAARSLYEECLTLFREIDNKPGVADALIGMGNALAKPGDYVMARPLYAESLALNREIGNKQGISGGLEGMATVLANGESDVQRAAVLWAAASILRESIGALQSLNEQALQAKDMAQARMTLNDESAWSAAWNVGLTLSYEQAIKLALRE